MIKANMADFKYNIVRILSNMTLQQLLTHWELHKIFLPLKPQRTHSIGENFANRAH